MPRHVGIIPDGNRRWARREGRALYEAYMKGYRNVVRVTEYLFDKGVDIVSVYGLSYDNCLKRSNGEKSIIEKIALFALRDLRRRVASRGFQVRVKFLGDPSIFGSRLAREASLTAKYLDRGDKTLILLVCYSGSWEARSYRCVTPPSLLLPPVDLIIRTGGARRLSGFLPILSEYAELYFTDTLWPDFSIEELEEALEWFRRQQRNFGR